MTLIIKLIMRKQNELPSLNIQPDMKFQFEKTKLILHPSSVL